MSLISFLDWIARESSASTRSKTAAALGLGPDVASVFGHSTPAPWIAEKLQEKLKKKSIKQSELPGQDPPKPTWAIPERVQNPDYSFDKWIKDAIEKSSELEDIKKSAEDDNEALDKEIADRLKADDKDDKDKEDKDKEDKDHLKKNDANDANDAKNKKGKEVKEIKSQKPQKNSQGENGGKESKWINQKKEMEKVGRRDSQKDS